MLRSVAASLLRARHIAIVAAAGAGTVACYYGPDAGSAERLARWQDRWEAGQIAFHKRSVHPALEQHLEDLFPAGRGPQRVLVPLCGKAVDMAWLAARGHEVVGVEGVSVAAQQFAQEHPSLAMSKLTTPDPKPQSGSSPDFIQADEFGGPKHGYVFTTRAGILGYHRDRAIAANAAAPKPEHSADWLSRGLLPGARSASSPAHGGVWIAVRDFFKTSRKDLGTFSRAWDRGSLVAVPPAVRSQYAAALDGLMAPKGRILLSCFDYDQAMAPGPPFAVTIDEVRRLFPRYAVRELWRHDVAPEFRSRKGTAWESIGHMDEVTLLLIKPRPLWRKLLWPFGSDE